MTGVKTMAAPVLKWTRAHVEGLVLAAAGVVVFLLFPFLFFVYPYLTIGPKQPIPFSHQLHAGVKKIDCRFCHPYVERSPRSGIPAVGKCLFCHEHVIPTHPEIRKIHEHHDAGRPIEWVRVFYLPDHVTFAHQPHIIAGVDCEECHGKVETMDRIPAVDMKMGFCLRCHRERGANLGCWLACHR